MLSTKFISIHLLLSALVPIGVAQSANITTVIAGASYVTPTVSPISFATTSASIERFTTTNNAAVTTRPTSTSQSRQTVSSQSRISTRSSSRSFGGGMTTISESVPTPATDEEPAATKSVGAAMAYILALTDLTQLGSSIIVALVAFLIILGLVMCCLKAKVNSDLSKRISNNDDPFAQGSGNAYQSAPMSPNSAEYSGQYNMEMLSAGSFASPPPPPSGFGGGVAAYQPPSQFGGGSGGYDSTNASGYGGGYDSSNAGGYGGGFQQPPPPPSDNGYNSGGGYGETPSSNNAYAPPASQGFLPQMPPQMPLQ
eukprot:Partr_v1_DN28971_c1_g1_i1_m24889